MAYFVLGQAAPAATTPTDVYTVPAGKSTVVSTIAVCSRSASTVTYRISVRPAGAVQTNAHYIVYENSITAKATDYHTVGITLGAADVITVYASTNELSFSVFGNES